jgi:hypothetical protein
MKTTYGSLWNRIACAWCEVRDEAKKAALEVVLSSLALEQAYDPVRISKEDAAGFLGLLVDSIVGAQSRGKVSSKA